MTPAARVMAYAAGTAVDRRPWTACLSLYGSRLIGVDAPDLYADGELYAAGQRAAVRAFAPDIVYGPFAIPLVAEAWGSRLRRHRHAPPTLEAPAAIGAEAVLSLPIPVPDAGPLAAIHVALRRMAADHPERIVAMAVPDPATLACLLLGQEGWLRCLLGTPASAARLLDHLLPPCIVLARSCLAAGAQVLVVPALWLSRTMLPPAIACERIRPTLVELIAAIPAPTAIHHGGGRLDGDPTLLAGFPANLIGIAPDAADDPRLIRAGVGPARVVFAGPQAVELPRLGPAGVRAAASRHLAACIGPAALGLAGPDVPYETPAECIEALRLCVEAEARGGDG